MRCTQIIGLNREACEFISKHTFSYMVYEDATDQGMFDDGPMLTEYVLQDGSKVREFIQAVPWSSGPCIFLALKDVESGKILFPWDEETINNA